VQAARRVEERYGRDDGSLRGYLGAMAIYAAGALGGGGAARVTQRRPAPLSPYELVTLGVATHKLSRLLAKDAVTSPLRAPFTRFHGAAGDAEIAEEVVGHGAHKSAGELLSCPFCLAPWVAGAAMAGRTFAPAATRAATGVLAAVAISDFLQLAYAAAQQRVTPADQRDG
jgi:hypothetical protein